MDAASSTGSRFPRETIRILRGWVSSHAHHPYPSDEDKEKLAQQTGLSKVQISTWMANSRRRREVRTEQPDSLGLQQGANDLQIEWAGVRLGEMNPMERWKNSPPEREPVPMSVIANAVSAAIAPDSSYVPFSSHNHIDDQSPCSIARGSSAGSTGTSHSGNDSIRSALSHKSWDSSGSLGSFGSVRKLGRHRRRRQRARAIGLADTQRVVHKFQCTFCTETFKTKHDWKRHEKSLHLSLERWVCSPHGSSQMSTERGCLACVYCGLREPQHGHMEQHNYLGCAGKALVERTFYRKDHIRQHLGLVHGVNFQAWSMDSWRMPVPEIRSRCGFCGRILSSWDDRADHISRHFKSGTSMVDWTGDWGFEPEILPHVENAIPPCEI